jgi:uncharacterized protein
LSRANYEHLQSLVVTFEIQAQLLGGVKVKPSEALRKHRAAIRHIVESHKAQNARVFGSVLHGVDTETSDLDILVDPLPEMTYFDIGAIRHELGQLLGVTVDVLTPKSLSDRVFTIVDAEAAPI